MDAVKDLVFKTMEQCDSDEMNRVQALTILHRVQKDLEGVVNQIKAWKKENISELENDISEYPDGYGGFTFEYRSGGKTFVYEGIKEYDQEKAKLKDLEAKYKAAYMALQSGSTPVDSETGEILEIPTVKYRASSIILKEKK